MLIIGSMALGIIRHSPAEVKLWDTGKEYNEKNPMWHALDDKADWVQAPYDRTDYEPQGDLIIENEFFYLFLFTNKEDSISLMTKVGDGGIRANEIYKVYQDKNGKRNFGMGTIWSRVLKITPEEITIIHAGIGAKNKTPVVTIYHIRAGKPWLEIQPIAGVNQQGMHGKSRMCAFVKKEGEDFILDSKREPFNGEVNLPAPEGSIGLINFSRGYRKDYDLMWFLTFPPGAEKHILTYLGFHADPFWEDPPRPDRPSVGAQYGYMGDGGVFIGVLNDRNNWKRENIERKIEADEVYQTEFKAPYPGEWKLAARITSDAEASGRYIHERVKIDEAGQPFTFRSPMQGMLDYIFVYLWDRTENTPESLFTPMDVYREVIESPEGQQQ